MQHTKPYFYEDNSLNKGYSKSFRRKPYSGFSFNKNQDSDSKITKKPQVPEHGNFSQSYYVLQSIIRILSLLIVSYVSLKMAELGNTILAFLCFSTYFICGSFTSYHKASSGRNKYYSKH